MITFFDNRSVGKNLCIDWDLFYDDFLNYAIPYTISLVRELRSILGEDFKVYYQRSAKNNVHIGFKFQRPLSVLDGFMIRAWMADDLKRLRLDQARYLKTGSLHEMNRCFQQKIEVRDGQASLYGASEWFQLDMDSLDDVPSTQESHREICHMQDECLKRKKEETKRTEFS